jgi:hypothetical protein
MGGESEGWEKRVGESGQNELDGGHWVLAQEKDGE